MNLTGILVVALSVLCLAENAIAADQDITVEFVGPWSFIVLADKIVAISPSTHHQPAEFGGPQKAIQLVRGVYQLTLSNPRPGNASGFTPCKVSTSSGTTEDCFVTATTPKSIYNMITAASPTGIDRYSVALPPGGIFELPPGDDYSETAVVTDYFIDPSMFVSSNDEKTYAKHVKIHYTVSDANGTLSGTPDTETWQSPGTIMGPFEFSVEPPKITNYFCDFHARQAFFDMNTLLQSGQFVDFPYYWGECRDKWDPQKPSSVAPAFEELTPPDSRHISIRYIVALIDDIRKNAGYLLKGSTPDPLKTLGEIEKYVQDRPWEHPELAKKLTKPLNLIVGNLEQLKLDRKDTAKKRLVEQEINVLGPLVAATSDSGANCKAPMMSLAVSP